MPTTYLLTADVGGTNSRLSLYDTDFDASTQSKLLFRQPYRNATDIQRHPNDPKKDEAAFGNCIIKTFLKYCWNHEDSKKLCPIQDASIVACLAVAGVVDRARNRVLLTNLDNLLVDGQALEKENRDEYLGQIHTCKIINDFVAQGYGCITLKPEEVLHLDGPKSINSPSCQGPKVCVGAGTGLGVCYLTAADSTYTCWPSEGGHVEFAPRNDTENRLWDSIRKKFYTGAKNRVSVERVVSGTGLANVYDFLVQDSADKQQSKVHKEFLNAKKDERPRVVAEHYDDDEVCRRSMDTLMSTYGSHVGSAAMTFIPTGGLYVTGGLTAKNVHKLVGDSKNKPPATPVVNRDVSPFLQAYRDKGRVSPLLDSVPLYAVLVEDLGERGAQFYATQLFLSDDTSSAKKGPFLPSYAIIAVAAAAAAALVALQKKPRN